MSQVAAPEVAVIDASFWINAERSGLLEYLPDYFVLKAPVEVAREITFTLGQSVPAQAATVFEEWHGKDLVEIVEPAGTFARFYAGENQAIAFAALHGCMLLIDNSEARHFSRGPLRLRVVDSPTFAVFLYDQGRLTYEQTREILRVSLAARRVVREAVIVLAGLTRELRSP
jgi:predicted nucleic acid-binding protein